MKKENFDKKMSADAKWKKNKLKHEKEEFSDNRLNIYMQECWLFECENYCKCAVNQASSSEEVQTEIIFINIASNCSDSGKILLWQQNQYQFEPIKKRKSREAIREKYTFNNNNSVDTYFVFFFRVEKGNFVQFFY